jgi:hypothetical protein
MLTMIVNLSAIYRFFVRAWPLAGIALLAACGGGGGGGSPPPAPAVAPTVTLSVSAPTATVGQSVTLTWSSTNATACTASDGWTGTLATSGTQAVAATAAGTANYTLTCTGPGGSAKNSAAVAVSAASVPLAAGPFTGYQKISTLSLAALDSTLGTETTVTVTQDATAGGVPVSFATAPGNVLYVLSPAEQFGDSASVLHLVGGSGKTWDLTISWATRLSTTLTRISEASETGAVPADDNITLMPTGIDASGAVSAATSALSFKLNNGPALDSTLNSISLNTSTSSVDVSTWFTYDAPSSTVTLAAANLLTLISTLQTAHKATLTFSLSTPDYAQTFGFEQVLTFSGGTVNGAVINTDGTAATDFAGVSFVVTGFNTGTTALVKASATGTFVFSNLPADSYEVRQALLAPGVALIGFASLTDPAGSVSLTITKVPGAKAAAVSNFAAAQSIETSSSAVSAAVNHPERTQVQTHAQRRSVKSIPAGAAYTATVTAGAADTLIVTPVTYTVPKGSTQVAIHVDVDTAEYPVYTTAQSQFNDIWLFDVQLPPPLADFQQSGKVNQTHVASGTISFDQCVDFTSAAAAADVPVSGQLGAQNVADANLPTTVTLSISLSCTGGLNITKFQATNRSTDGGYIIYPKHPASDASPDGNLAGQYLSVPLQARLPGGWGLVTTLNYAPSTTTLTQIELFQRTPGGDVSLGKDYLTQADVSTPGVAKFTGLTLNPTGLAPVTGRMQLVAVATGTIAGGLVSSQPTPLTVDGFASFTPLYLTSELSAYNAANRFGQRDPGGDSWGTTAMTTWIFAEGLRYNDISAALVKQGPAPSYRSVLGHSGHSDAQQVDVRYYDGSGGFSDTLGGLNAAAGVKTLASAALAEVTSKATTTPNLTSLVTWITANRTGLAGYAARGEVRRIYIGNAHVAQLLVEGVFPGTSPATAIPGITAWSNKAAKILVQPDHLDHWHISTNNP